MKYANHGYWALPMDENLLAHADKGASILIAAVLVAACAGILAMVWARRVRK